MKTKQSGQALIIIIFAIAISITIMTGGILSAIGVGRNTLLNEGGSSVYYSAESGIEYGILKVIRNLGSSCSGPNSLLIGSATVAIIYTPSGANCQIDSSAVANNLNKKVRVQTTVNNQVVTYTSWKEMP